jgi:hypothetical protein
VRISLWTLALAAVGALAACSDNTGVIQWAASADTVTLISASRADVSGLGSGFDITTRLPVVIERLGAAGAYDFAITEENGAFTLTPAGVLLGTSNRAGIVPTTDTSLAAVRSATSDTSAYIQLHSVPIQVGPIYVIRSRRVSCVLTTGSYYGKLQVLSVDAAAGLVKFQAVENPNCGDRALVPPGS